MTSKSQANTAPVCMSTRPYAEQDVLHLKAVNLCTAWDASLLLAALKGRRGEVLTATSFSRAVSRSADVKQESTSGLLLRAEVERARLEAQVPVSFVRGTSSSSESAAFFVACGKPCGLRSCRRELRAACVISDKVMDSKVSPGSCVRGKV